MLVGDTPDKTLSYAEMSNNLMAGRVACGNNEEIRKILAGCFKRDMKDRLSPSQLLEAINNEIRRQERNGLMRPQSVQLTPMTSTVKVVEMAHPQPNPSESSHQRSMQNRHMTPSASERHSGGYEESRSQSPFKTRFVNTLGGGPDPSPFKSLHQKDESPRKVTIKGQGNNLKNLTEMLLFLYRLLSFLGESDLQGANFMRLILFRHRSHLESSVERVMAGERLDRSTYEPFKEFQYLKSRFDEAYLQKESQPNSSPLPTQVLSRLNELSNQLFTDMKSLLIYCGLIIEAGRECERMINSDTLDSNESSNIGVLLDYLMIHF